MTSLARVVVVLVVMFLSAETLIQNARALELQSGQSADGSNSAGFKPPISVPDLYIPMQCYLGGELTDKACDVIDVAQFTYDLGNAFTKPDAMLQVSKVLLANRPVILKFAAGFETPRIDLMIEMYKAEEQFFKEIQEQIGKDLIDDRAKAAWLRTQARLDSAAVQGLIAQVYAEQQTLVSSTQNYLEANTVPGFRFNCLLACQQLVAAANGVNVFDTAGGSGASITAQGAGTSSATPATTNNLLGSTSNGNTSSPSTATTANNSAPSSSTSSGSTAGNAGATGSGTAETANGSATSESNGSNSAKAAHGHTGLIVGGILAGAGAAGAAAAYGLKNQNQSSQSCQAPEHCNALSPGPPGCTSGQDFLNALNAYCQCAGFPSGHDLGAGASCP